MSDLDDLDFLYTNTSTSAPAIPPGEYVVRADAVELTRSQHGTPGLRVRFRIEEGPFAGRYLSEDCWLTEAAMPVSKKFLKNAGFENMNPSAILAFQNFSSLPLLRALVSAREYQGRQYSDIKRLTRIPTRDVTKDGSAPR